MLALCVEIPHDFISQFREHITCTKGNTQGLAMLVHSECTGSICTRTKQMFLQFDELDMDHDSHAALCLTGTSRAKLREMYNELGDLGDVAQACRHTQASTCCLPTVHASPHKPYPALQ